ncbi:MAG: hypothetical protein JNM24_00315 [Bdellovibrionaceae bacterium]|nr:hypothetical protein [Pseudobdellovibrionaceae bacterium]
MSKLCLVILSLLFSFFAQSAAPTREELEIDDTDIQALNKIVTGKVPHGKFAGKTLNTAIRRPLYVMGTGTGASELLVDKLQNDTVMVGNFYHNGEFYVARIPVSRINSVVLLIAPFSKMASHTMLRFVTDSDARIELVAKIESNAANTQVSVKPLEEPIAIKDMIFSIDGTEPRGQGGWNMKDAIAGAYTIAHRLVSVQERFRWFILEGTPIKQIELNVNRNMAQRLARKGIETSQSEAWSRGYHLLCANCTNLAIRLVKNNVPYNERSDTEPRLLKQILQEKLDPFLKLLEPFTQFTRFNLGTLGWLGKNKVDLQNEPEFEKEMMEVVQDLRSSIARSDSHSEVEKAELYKNLGVDEGVPLLKNPALYSVALKAFKSAVVAATSRAMCLQFYGK